MYYKRHLDSDEHKNKLIDKNLKKYIDERIDERIDIKLKELELKQMKLGS
jgi:hypothetical protein